MKYGYMGKLLRVDLTHRKTSEQEFLEDSARKYIGGSGLGARFLFDETNENTTAFGEDNLLMFLTGPLVGTPVPFTGRHAVVTKSPLGIWGEGDSGGSWGVTLKKTGYDGVIIVGKSEKPVYLFITEEGAQIKDAKYVWGKDTYETYEILKRETTEKAEIIGIGPAAEKLANIAVTLCNGRHARASGRGGIGAVMGSKKLKSIVVFGNKRPKIAHPEKLRALVREYLPRVKERTKGASNYGTAGTVIKNGEIGDMPIKNWSMGKWEDEKFRKISGQAMAETILTGKYSCKGCVIGCGRVVKISDGPYAGVSGAGPEYEVLASLGSMCLIDNLNAIAMGNELCNRYGIDTISTGTAISFAMEAYEKGIITEKDTDGIQLAWGDEKAMIEMVHKIGKREGFGKLLGEGVKSAAQEIGGNSAEFAIEVKGLEPPMHDPRAMGSMAVAYATYPRGACHRGCSHYLERGGIPELGYDSPLNRQQDEGKGIATAKMQDYAGLFNSLKICQMTLTSTKLSEVLSCLNFVTGWDIDIEEFMQAGERATNLKRMYNIRLGLSRKEDTAPIRILTEEFKDGGAAGYLPHLGKMLNEYYQYRKWSKEGIPLPSTLEKLDLIEEANFLKDLYPFYSNE